jgi:hypothetical protein
LTHDASTSVSEASRYSPQFFETSRRIVNCFRGDDIAMLDQRHDASCCGPVAAWMRLPRSPLFRHQPSGRRIHGGLATPANRENNLFAGCQRALTSSHGRHHPFSH